MANQLRYFDTNGTTSGFGNYSGQSWSGSFWTTSTAGTTPAPAAFTFDATDTAQFGRTGTAVGTIGTITAPSVNFVVGTIKTEALGSNAFRINYGGGTCYLTMGSSLITFDMGSQMYFEPPISGTGGLRYQGSATLQLAADVYNLTGTITNAGTGSFEWIPWTDDQYLFQTKATYNIGNTSPNFVTNTLSKTRINFNADFSGSGFFQLQGDRSDASILVNILGTTAGVNGYSGTYAISGLGVWSRGTLVLKKDLPRMLHFGSPRASETVTIRAEIPAGAGTTTFPTTAYVSAFIANAAGYTALFESSGSLPLSFGDATTGSVIKDPNNSPSQIITFALGGTNTGENVMLYGTTAPAGSLRFSKQGAGYWTLAGNNSAFLSSAITGGTVKATNSNAFGGNINMATGTALELAGGITVPNANTNALGTIRNVSGNNAMSGDLTLAGALTVEAQADSLTLSGLITGSTAFAKTGSGLATLSNTSNNFTSSPSISAGTLAIPAIAALGAGSGLALSSSGVLRYTGSTGGTLSRAVTGTGLSGAGFDNTGSGSLAVTNATMDGTISLAASNSASQFNTLTATIGSGGFTKTGDGRWIINKLNNLSGTTTVSAGTLMAAPEAASASAKLLGGNVTVAAGAKIQTSSDNSQLGRNNYSNLTFAGASGNPARIRIGGSAVSPTVQMSGNLTISGAVTWNLTADVFKSPGTYRLVEFVSGALVGNITDVTVQVPTGRSVPPGGLVYDASSSPKTITVTVN